MTQKELLNKLKKDELDGILKELYTDIDKAKERYENVIKAHEKDFGEKGDITLFSTPGRTEIAGNHTDHQHGRVLAGAVNLDIIAAASTNDEGVIRIHSIGHAPNEIKLSDLSMREEEKGTADALIRGIAYRMKELGCALCGFDACTTSDVFPGSGLSSSAAFEILVATIINNLFNDDYHSMVELAKVSQFAECEYFGKPSGLMDQTACAVGGCVAIDFKVPEEPVLEKVSFNLAQFGYNLVIVNTGADHSDLTDDYASVPKDMKKVANEFGELYLRDVGCENFFEKIKDIRKKVGDKAVLRALHFIEENDRVPLTVKALKENNIEDFFAQILNSGKSSFQHLQNIYSDSKPNEQSMTLALALSERVLTEGGAYRVHGGGFAGTIQAFVKDEQLDEYVKTLESVFGEGSCLILNIRNKGSIRVI